MEVTSSSARVVMLLSSCRNYLSTVGTTTGMGNLVSASSASVVDERPMLENPNTSPTFSDDDDDDTPSAAHNV